MIKQIEITGIHYDVSDKMKKYVVNKIGRLDRFVPRKIRRSVRADVKLTETPGTKNEKYHAEIVFHMPNSAQLTASEATLNMYAAIDIVEAKLKNQLRKHKDKHLQHRHVNRKGIFDRVRRVSDRDWWGRQN